MAFLGCSCCHAQEADVTLPKTDASTSLRVLVLNSHRFPTLSKYDVETILASSYRQVKQHFEIDIRFGTPVFQPLNEIADAMPTALSRWTIGMSLDMSKSEDVLALGKVMQMQLLQHGGSLEDLQRFSAPYLLYQPRDSSLASFSDALSKTQTSLISQWKAELLADKKPLLMDDGLSDYLFWAFLGYWIQPYEIVITNQIIASAEKVGNTVHTALRGGLSNGVNNSSKLSTTGAVSVLSIFPFVSNDPVTVRLRNGKTYKREEALTYAAALLSHEIGHQLLHLGHPFDNPACLMRPPVRLHFDDWYSQLDSKKCALNSSDTMTPGRTVKFTYIRN